jgi:hypothetical protein
MRRKFTPEEDALIIQYVNEYIEQGKGITGPKMYKEFAEEVSSGKVSHILYSSQILIRLLES